MDWLGYLLQGLALLGLLWLAWRFLKWLTAPLPPMPSSSPQDSPKREPVHAGRVPVYAYRTTQGDIVRESAQIGASRSRTR